MLLVYHRFSLLCSSAKSIKLTLRVDLQENWNMMDSGNNLGIGQRFCRPTQLQPTPFQPFWSVGGLKICSCFGTWLYTTGWEITWITRLCCVAADLAHFDCYIWSRWKKRRDLWHRRHRLLPPTNLIYSQKRVTWPEHTSAGLVTRLWSLKRVYGASVCFDQSVDSNFPKASGVASKLLGSKKTASTSLMRTWKAPSAPLILKVLRLLAGHPLKGGFLFERTFRKASIL